MNKQKVVVVGVEAREKLLKGAYFLADAVKSTLGPFGQNAISGLKGQIKVTNDGVTIAQDISLEDEIENLGAQTLKEAAIKTNDKAGDGTTSAVAIAQAVLKEAVPYLKSEKTMKGRMSPIALKKQIEKETKEVITKLEAMASPITSKEQLIDSALVSVEDEALATMIGTTQWEMGKDGTILAEETNDESDSIERVRGIRIDNGFGTSLVLNNLEKQTLEVKNVRVILTNHTLSGNKALEPISQILQSLAKMGVTDVVIIARAFSNEAIQLCMENHKTGFRLYPLNAPYVDQAQVMKDLAAITGGGFINEEERNLESMQLSDVGFAEQVVAARFSAIITGAQNDEHIEELVTKRITELEGNHQGSESEFEKRGIEARISQLKNGFALLKVGAPSLVERKYKFDKVTDSVNATKSALRYGVVPGAGVALKRIADDMPDTSILKRPLLAPYNQIMENAGEVFEIPEWVKDPLEVVRVGLINATSVAIQLATAAVAYTWKNDEPTYVKNQNKVPQRKNHKSMSGEELLNKLAQQTNAPLKKTHL